MFLIFINYFHITRDLERWADGQLISTQKYYGKGEQQVRYSHIEQHKRTNRKE
jgi:hypothetical protein